MECLKLLTPEAAQQLILNHQQQEPLRGTRQEIDFTPVCKLFVPWSAGTWLLTEMDDDCLAFGLADLGVQCPEIGYVSLDEIWEVRGPGGLRIEQDLHWTAKKTLGQYADESRQLGYIRA
jgi:hypothetical protein